MIRIIRPRSNNLLVLVLPNPQVLFIYLNLRTHIIHTKSVCIKHKSKKSVKTCIQTITQVLRDPSCYK